ncbi:hypothetical protein [Salmon gill poxvirus]|nr:hypothetical protein [Salmon gill poxvirus]
MTITEMSHDSVFQGMFFSNTDNKRGLSVFPLFTMNNVQYVCWFVSSKTNSVCSVHVCVFENGTVSVSEQMKHIKVVGSSMVTLRVLDVLSSMSSLCSFPVMKESPVILLWKASGGGTAHVFIARPYSVVTTIILGLSETPFLNESMLHLLVLNVAMIAVVWTRPVKQCKIKSFFSIKKYRAITGGQKTKHNYQGSSVSSSDQANLSF